MSIKEAYEKYNHLDNVIDRYRDTHIFQHKMLYDLWQAVKETARSKK